MPSFETILLALLSLAAAGGALALVAALRRGRTSPAMAAVGLGRFTDALALADPSPGGRAGRDDLWAAAVAARHLLRLDAARAAVDRLLALFPDDGEGWLESGLTAAYAGDLDRAERDLLAAAALRSDLTESITLHRAWVALRRGGPDDLRTARRLFDEVEAPLESKLRSDLGGGEPLFAEWFLHAAALWAASGDAARADWAARAGRASAPESHLADLADTVLRDSAGLPLQ
jgi:tetratricopeptide (TPR) repeat protein